MQLSHFRYTACSTIVNMVTFTFNPLKANEMNKTYQISNTKENNYSSIFKMAQWLTLDCVEQF